jgi:anti-sigma-K factor RskA
MDYARESRADALAAQYVAGTLRGRARARFENLLPGHPALREAVQAWQQRLMPLTLTLEPVAPPPRVWHAIEARLWPHAAAATANASAPAGWWQRLALWRGLSGLATAAVLVLTVALVRTPPPVPAGPPIVVVLEGQAGTAAAGATFVASVAGDGQSMVMQPVSANVPLQTDRVLELWSVPPNGAPRSLGLIKADGLTVLPRSRLPETLLKGGTAALAVSVEPPGGSPTGAPTGPVVFAGKLQI